MSATCFCVNEGGLDRCASAIALHKLDQRLLPRCENAECWRGEHQRANPRKTSYQRVRISSQLISSLSIIKPA